MSSTRNYIGIDLGAESGRVLVGMFDGSKVVFKDVHRFPNGPVRLLDSLHWDVLRLFQEIKEGLRICVREYGKNIQSIGVDTWGVDFGLFDKDDVLLCNPYHYRDSRTDGMMEEAFKKVPREIIFEHTGIQFLKLNTLFQLYSMVLADSAILRGASSLLMMPDLLNFWLTGVKVSEFTEATTSQMFDPRKRAWARDLFGMLGVPFEIMQPIIEPGEKVGSLFPSVALETGLPEIPVIAPGTHDTASAVAAVPAGIEKYAYISSGTWSLMGAEIKKPVVNKKSLEYNFTNEGGVFKTFRFLKNIMGMWPVQECRRRWSEEGRSYSYDDLTGMAEAAKPFNAVFNPDHESILSPGDMPARIREFCRETGQAIPGDEGSIVRMALEGLALKYRWTLDKMEEILNYKVEAIHIVGGGSRNRLLNQFTADATGLPVIAGPIEATALGNILMQAHGTGEIANLSDLRQVVRNSFSLSAFEPSDKAPWDEAYAKFQSLIA